MANKSILLVTNWKQKLSFNSLNLVVFVCKHIWQADALCSHTKPNIIHIKTRIYAQHIYACMNEIAAILEHSYSSRKLRLRWRKNHTYDNEKPLTNLWKLVKMRCQRMRFSKYNFVIQIEPLLNGNAFISIWISWLITNMLYIRMSVLLVLLHNIT